MPKTCQTKLPDIKPTVEIRETSDSKGRELLYERHESIIPVTRIDHKSTNKIACEACHKFGQNLACPPYSPNFENYLEGMCFARVICIRMPMEYFRNNKPEDLYQECFKAAKTVLDKDLLEYRKQGHIIAGSGYCHACRKCIAEQGGTKCIKPEKLIYSLESLGVNLTGLTRSAFNFDLEWSAMDHTADFVCAIGAVFYPGEPT